jgi:hypothetical protein
MVARKARLEGEGADIKSPRATPEHAALKVIVERFKDEHPVVWERIRLGPTQHGLEQMIDTLADA